MPFYEPYPTPAANALYNLVFADDPAAFANVAPSPADRLHALFADRIDAAAVTAIAADESVEARLRVVAYQRLREAGQAVAKGVPKGILLGAIVEMPLDGGLDTLAAYVDKRVRYINHTGAMSIFEDATPALEAPLAALLRAAQTLVEKIGPWERERLAPPKRGHVRLSFLVSDGLYFGEAGVETMASDPLGAAVLHAAGQLLTAVVDTTLAAKKS